MCGILNQASSNELTWRMHGYKASLPDALDGMRTAFCTSRCCQYLIPCTACRHRAGRTSRVKTPRRFQSKRDVFSM